MTTRHLWGLKARCSPPRQRGEGFEVRLLALPLKVMGLLIFPSSASSSVRGAKTPAFGRNSMKHLVLSPETIISMTPSKLKGNSKSQFTAHSNYWFISMTSWRTQPLLSMSPGDTQGERWDLPKDSDCAVSILISPPPTGPHAQPHLLPQLHRFLGDAFPIQPKSWIIYSAYRILGSKLNKL